MKSLALSLLLALPAAVQASEVIKGIKHTEGNSITHLKDGIALQDARRRLFGEAKSSIYISAFSVSTDDIGKELFETLCQKAKDGLEVRLIYDHRNNKNFLDYAQRLKEECKAYVIAYRPSDRLYSLHEKLMIIDGQKLIAGGSGYSRKYFLAAPDSYKVSSPLRQIRPDGWYDSDYLVEGPAACTLHHQFRTHFVRLAIKWQDYNPDMRWYGYENFAQMTPKYYGLGRFRNCVPGGPGGSERAIAIHNQPNGSSARPILAAHLGAIDQTVKGEEIRLYAPYFVPHPKMVEALVSAIKRGVDVKVITNSVETTDEKSFGKAVFIGMIEYSRPLLKAGAKIYLWNQTGTLHRKGGVIGKAAYFGSDNLDIRAQNYNAEDVIYTDAADVVSGTKQDFERDLGLSTILTNEYIQKVYDSSSIKDRFIGKKFKHWL